MIVICKHNAGLENLPGTFAGLMDLYERNYIGIRRLIPAMPRAGTAWLSQAPDSIDLHLRVIERFRYTTELSLTYHFQKDHKLIAEPDLHIRIYHDARQAEVLSARLRHRPYFSSCFDGYTEGARIDLRARWHVNRFLYKWLNYCLHQKHCFVDSHKQVANLD